MTHQDDRDRHVWIIFESCLETFGAIDYSRRITGPDVPDGRASMIPAMLNNLPPGGKILGKLSLFESSEIPGWDEN